MAWPRHEAGHCKQATGSPEQGWASGDVEPGEGGRGADRPNLSGPGAQAAGELACGSLSAVGVTGLQQSCWLWVLTARSLAGGGAQLLLRILASRYRTGRHAVGQ